ncbi:Ribosomal_protein L17 [Hexamita inflata]|uniref:Ribosomal protein L17 n=1 Tax=Hexamita inflata TaxID=28002 RepID=A0AA86QL71_9EUKA|nr:Ribosomal protein L17 [Hexamita inflata]CAI9931870.1 Ribosomal protein L17 [Hexamita inflata]CAI9933382.1 Ribosomal protein L17 [Hexamita inflata]CAI9958552.1 Ribosomal protein L17 [Hexamita inflata]
MARKYAYQSGAEQVGKSRLDNAQVSYKKTYGVCRAITGMKVERALEYLDNVVAHQEIVPIFKFHGGASRHAQANSWGINSGRWPEKSVRLVRNLLVQAAAHAKALHQVEKETLVVKSTFCGLSGQINHRRNYRAHGRVNGYNSEPCHVQIICSPSTEKVAVAKDLKQ